MTIKIDAPARPDELVNGWWNDVCRKDWRQTFEDPARRGLALGDLATRIVNEARVACEAMREALSRLVRRVENEARHAEECALWPIADAREADAECDCWIADALEEPLDRLAKYRAGRGCDPEGKKR